MDLLESWRIFCKGASVQTLVCMISEEFVGKVTGVDQAPVLGQPEPMETGCSRSVMDSGVCVIG